MTTHLTHFVDETAPVIVRVSTTINAALAKVWDIHTDIGAWATWNPDISQAEFAGPLVPGETFHWLTHGLDITSTVREVVPAERIVWGGPAHGIDGVHVWMFDEKDGVVTVRTEESWSGAPIEAQPAAMEQALRQSLESWLGHLKSEAEQR
ncbi:SRPBCC family protein [Streptomyces sp. AK02-01A]|uniref:SRPBCC family protein n=1 Tax=Streptomyces sp. AK02-01A TaxID=3028648 RepID=UPI0029A0062D|nr:SRPBCC family protein [Streptomyces sp. AK02-01A]MDX3853150.1 SRPBCC family protein [Streptomyces sp. AK02-01A]